MPLGQLVVLLIFIGIGLAVLNKFGPPYVDGKIITLVNWVVMIAVFLWIIDLFFGFPFGGWGNIRVGK